MQTSNFWLYKGDGRISIARFYPRFEPAGLLTFKELAPGAWFNKVSEAEYIRLYNTDILGRLNPLETWNKLHALTGGAEPVLLCYEKPGEFCHRRLVAEWFKRELGYDVPEYVKEQEKPAVKQRTIEDFLNEI